MMSMTVADDKPMTARDLGRMQGSPPADDKRVTDKYPANFVHLGLIALKFGS